MFAFRIIIYISLIHFSICEKTSDEKFVPTEEWQTVKPGQRLPAGLHIRHDFQKKITEAKLLDESENSENNAITEVKDVDEDGNTVIDGNVFTSIPDDLERDLDREENVKKKFRSYEELKKEFGMLNMTVKTDAELMIELFSRYKNLTEQVGLDNSEEFLSILTDLEYLTHQIDNGIEFIKMDGFHKIIFPSLKFPSVNLKIESLKVFSAAVQHNPKVQIHAFEKNALSILLNLMVDSGDDQVSTYSLSTIISLLRRFPTAQLMFIQLRGLDKLIDYINKNSNDKFESKVFSLLNDLISDNINYNVSEHKNISNVASGKIISYIEKTFVSQGWCNKIEESLSNKFNVMNHNFENIFSLIKLTMKMCSEVYKEPSFQIATENILSHYDKLAKIESEENIDTSESDDTDFYFTHLRDFIKNVTQKIYSLSLNEDKQKDEL